MSADTTVEVSQQADGSYTAVESETGATGEGASRAEALADLAQALANIESAVQIADFAVSLQEAIAVQQKTFQQLLDMQTAAVQELVETTKMSVEEGLEIPQKALAGGEEDLPNASEFIELSQDVQERFEEENIDEDDVEDAIRWARSQ